MIKSKSLGESGWKEILSKNKGLKDNGLQKALAELGKSLEAEDFDASLKGLDVALKLAGQLKKSKEVSAVAAAAKHMGEVIDAAETAIKEVNKAKAEAEKKAKADAAAQAKKKEKDDENDAGDEEEESSDLLTTKLIPLLRTVKGKGEKMHALIATTGKQVVVLLSRKPISPARRKLLKDELGGAGGIKYIPGHCIREHGKVTFVLEKQVSGMRKLIEAALYEQTKQRTKVKCRTQDGEYDDESGHDRRDRVESRESGIGRTAPALHLQAGNSSVLGKPARDHEGDPLAHVDGVIADALVVAADQGQLHRGPQTEPVGVVRAEDRFDELHLQLVEAVVDVVEGRRETVVGLDERVDGLAGERGRFDAHVLDEAAHVRAHRHVVDASRRLADVDHQVGRALELAREAKRTHDEAKITRHRLLQGEQPVAALLDADRERVDDVVAVDQRLRSVKVAIEHRRRALADRLDGQGAETNDVVAELVERFVELDAEIGVAHVSRRAR